MARRPQGADPPRLAPSPERALAAHADQGAAGEAIWARCAKAFGYPEWCEAPRFASNQARMANREALEAVMNAVLTTKTTNDWVKVLEAAGVPCGPVYDYAQMFADPQVRHRGLVQYCKRPGARRGPAHPHADQDRRRCGYAMSPPSSANTAPKSLAASGDR